MKRRFMQVDVFSQEPCKGNALGVVLDAQGLSEEQMRDYARWSNLSEVTFVLPAEDEQADYRFRIFAGEQEFPFAGQSGSSRTSWPKPRSATARAPCWAVADWFDSSRRTEPCGPEAQPTC